MIKRFALAMVVLAMPAFAQQAGPRAPAAARLGSGPMVVDDWASLGTYSELPVGGHSKLDVQVPKDGVEEITVYGTRDKRDRAWRDELHDSGGGGYEPASSVAGTPEYGQPPAFLGDGKSERGLMNGAKAATGACGALFGLISCDK